MTPQTTTPIATLDEFELPPPPNTAPLEWAIAWMQAFAAQTSPVWTGEDITRYFEAFLHASNPAEAISRGWRKRLRDARGAFETLIRRRGTIALMGWHELGDACFVPAVPDAETPLD